MTRAAERYRPDIQGLRAVAVTLVVVYHLAPTVLPGGFIGVDVFFVISGYLITGALARTLRQTGHVDPLEFWGRRARRLLPAATLVLAVTWIGSLAVLPVTRLSEVADQVRASALYFQNWQLAGNAVDYLKADEASTPVQHFWSLSVEEQFYLVWPMVFVLAAAAAWWARRRAAATGRHRQAQGSGGPVGSGAGAVTALLLAVVVVGLSLAYSVHETQVDPAAAYFVTTTRMWELALGGVATLLPAAITARLGRVGVLAWLGAAAVVSSALFFSGSTAFPGYAALLPVLGTAFMLLCGSSAARLGPARLTSSRPFVFVGGISYSLYLWHWPLIVLYVAYRGHPVGKLSAPAIVVASVVLAWLTKRFVEDPVRMTPILTRSRARSLATALVVVLPVALVAVWLSGQSTSSSTLDAAHPGAAALSRATPTATAPLVPTLATASTDTAQGITTACESSRVNPAVKSCVLGDTKDPRLTVALVGDSHAGQWSDALDAIGKEQRWKIVASIKGECPLTTTEVSLVGQKTPDSSCTQWGKSVMNDLLTKIKPDVVIVSDRPYNAVLPDEKADATSLTAVGQGMAEDWTTLMAHGIAVVAIGETPEPGKNVPDCLAGKGGSITSCGQPASVALTKTSPVGVAAAQTEGAVPVINMDDLICPGTVCPPVIGNTIVYLDSHHLTRTYTTSLIPYLSQRLLATSALSSGAGSR